MRKRIRSSGHTPVRTCVGCGQRRAASELYRCVLSSDRIDVDRNGFGRGAWVCGPACLPAAQQRRGFDRAWRRSVPPELVESLRQRWLEDTPPAERANR